MFGLQSTLGGSMAELTTEVRHWAVLGKLNERADEGELGQLVEWALRSRSGI
jgi:hypothetical protein